MTPCCDNQIILTGYRKASSHSASIQWRGVLSVCFHPDSPQRRLQLSSGLCSGLGEVSAVVGVEDAVAAVDEDESVVGDGGIDDRAGIVALGLEAGAPALHEPGNA